MSKDNPLHWTPNETHHKKYMKGTLDFKFCLEDKDIALRIFCDMDLAEDANN